MKALKTILNALFRTEHALYCTTGIEMPFHRAYYRRRRDKYMRYRAQMLSLSTNKNDNILSKRIAAGLLSGKAGVLI